MPIDIAVLATSLVGQVLLPYAKVGLKKLGEELKDRLGGAVEAQATSLAKTAWEKVTSLFSGSDEDRFMLQKFEKSPDKAAPLLEEALQEKLAAAPKAAEELDKLLKAPLGTGGPAFQSVMAETFGYVDARGAVISGGQVAGVIIEPSPKPGPPGPQNPPKP